MKPRHTWPEIDKEKEAEFKKFCKDNNITKVKREYYFTLNGMNYRVSPYMIGVTDMNTVSIPIRVAKDKRITMIRAHKADVVIIYNGLKEGKSFKEIGKIIASQKTPPAAAKPAPEEDIKLEPVEEEVVVVKPVAQSSRAKQNALINSLLKKR